MLEARRQRATGIIVNDGKVLLFRRVKRGRTFYCFPGGGADDGESVEEALRREIQEELTLTVILHNSK
jgi:8-oxo-dGTP pyrophosphatase MutT (NUDIX family)